MHYLKYNIWTQKNHFDYRVNIDLKVERETLKQQIDEKSKLLREALDALEQMESEKEQERSRYEEEIVELKKCLPQWCYILFNKNKGWVTKNNLWGVYKNEKYNIPFYQPLINYVWKINFKYF